MVGLLLDRHRDREQLVLRRTVDGDHVGETRLSFRERPGLIESDRTNQPERLEVRTALHEHARPRCSRNARQHGAWSRDGECARARGHEYRHGSIEASREGFVDHDPREE